MIHWCPPDLYWHVARRLNFQQIKIELLRIKTRVNVIHDKGENDQTQRACPWLFRGAINNFVENLTEH